MPHFVVSTVTMHEETAAYESENTLIDLLVNSESSDYTYTATVLELPTSGKIYEVTEDGKRGKHISTVPRVLSNKQVMFNPGAGHSNHVSFEYGAGYYQSNVTNYEMETFYSAVFDVEVHELRALQHSNARIVTVNVIHVNHAPSACPHNICRESVLYGESSWTKKERAPQVQRGLAYGDQNQPWYECFLQAAAWES